MGKGDRFLAWVLGTLIMTGSGAGLVGIPRVAIAETTTVPTDILKQAEAQQLWNEGLEQYKTSQLEAALQPWQQALKLYRELGDSQAEVKLLGSLGNAHHALSNYSQALDYYTQSLAIARQIKDQRSEGITLGNLGNVYGSMGNYPKAIESLEQGLAIARQIKDPYGEATALRNLGTSYNALSNYPKAIDYYTQSLAIARKIKDWHGAGTTLVSLGGVYNSLGNYAKAIENHTQSLAIARGVKDRFTEGKALGNLGNAYYALGNYAQAIEYLEQSLAIAQQIKDRRSVGTVSGFLGNAYYSLGNYPKAIEYHQQELAIAQQIQNRLGEGNAFTNLGNAYNALSNYAKAIEYHTQSLAIARQIQDRFLEKKSLGNLGNAYNAQRNYAKAIEYYNQTLALTRQIQDRLGEGISLNNLGLAQLNSENFSQAEQQLFAAIAVYESLRSNLQNTDKVSIADTQRQAYNNLQRVLIAQNKTESALEVAERGRARAFVELLAKRVQPATASPTAISLAQMQQVAKAKQATLVQYSVIFDLALFVWVVQPSGAIHFRQVDLTVLKPQNITLENLISTARCLGMRSCERYFAQQGTRQLVFHPPRAEATPEAEAPVAVRPATRQEDTALSNPSLQQLHQLLIRPITDLLPSDPNAPVVFIPQDGLFLVPFAALQDAQNNYLIDRHTIVTAPAIQVLQLTQQQRQKLKQSGGQDKLVVGNPIMPQFISPDGKVSTLAPLPGAETEAKAIAALLNTQPLLGAQATESEVIRRMPQARIIHLATHGVFDDQQGLRSAMALAPAPGKRVTDNPSDASNGWLTADEILDLKLQAELVVLSACDTGRGRITGDGVIGLSRSLISAGVPSVLVSLWAVPDAPTATLMTQFYKNWQQQPNKAIALRQAMLSTKQQHPRPRDWAAFVLIGEME